MRALGIWRIALFCLAILAVAQSTWAQNVILDAPGLIPQKRAPGPPPPRAAPTVWPRLDPGAVLCSTEDDLQRYAANLIARVRGGDLQPADCRMINQPVGISILARHGPGSTQVKLAGTGNVVGWTNVWLPDKAPIGR